MDNTVLSIIEPKPSGLIGRWQMEIWGVLMISLATPPALAQPSSVYVNSASTCSNRTGDRVCSSVQQRGPYRAVGEGALGVSPGGVVSIQGGAPDRLYPEAVFLNKRMEIRAESGTVTIRPPSRAPFDLVADRLDDNGLPLNPKWGGQLISGTPPDPDQCPRTSQFPTYPFTYPDPSRFPCTNQFTSKYYGPLCGPHINWFGATYETDFDDTVFSGRLTWDQHSCPLTDDDDYSMNLRRRDQAGYSAARDTIHIEFDSGETVDRITTDCGSSCSQWWREFKSAVDSDDDIYGCGTTGPSAYGMLNGNLAIVTGLVGFDVEHDVHVELHPVWALAINTRVRFSDWAFFVRNWGNEGFCGRDQQFAYFPNNQYTFRLPWKPGATLIDYGSTWHHYNTHQREPDIRIVEGQAIYVTFFLDPPADQGSMWDGELHLYWAP